MDCVMKWPIENIQFNIDKHSYNTTIHCLMKSNIPQKGYKFTKFSQSIYVRHKPEYER